MYFAGRLKTMKEEKIRTPLCSCILLHCIQNNLQITLIAN